MATPNTEGRSFWQDYGPGMLDLGANIYGQSAARNEWERRMRQAQGPLYNTQIGLAGKALGAAGSMDPKALAAERFAAQEGLLAPGRASQEQELMARLQKQGLLGVSSFKPVAGTVATPGVSMNPHLAALYAAQEGSKAQSAYDALGQGEKYLDDQLKRAGMLQTQAVGGREAGQKSYMSKEYGRPSSPSIAQQLIKGGVNILKDPAARGNVGGMLGGGWDWLRGTFGSPSAASSFTPDMWSSSYDSLSNLWE
jgi:hypothetical protein